MPRAGGNQAEVPRTQLARLPADLRYDRAFQNVEALFKGMQMRLNDAPRIQEANADAHVHRAHPSIDVSDAAESGAVGFVETGHSGRACVDPGNRMHALCEAYQTYKAPRAKAPV